ncbi:MAG: helix-turn-helix transcriptional regulator [Candidatus Peribacteria bacterium]|nr:MAG: helix-turn-helix transcriptional regulator [Candidatus Peribacteria bacterium]
MISLRDLRTQHQLTMDEMAGIIGTTRQTYSRIEKGDSDLSLGQAVRLTDHFDINIDNFISDDV